MTHYDWARLSDVEEVKTAIGQRATATVLWLWGRPDNSIRDQLPRLSDDVDGLLELVKRANKDLGAVTEALNEIDTLRGCGPEQYAITLGKVFQIAAQARQKLNL